MSGSLVRLVRSQSKKGPWRIEPEAFSVHKGSAREISFSGGPPQYEHGYKDRQVDENAD